MNAAAAGGGADMRERLLKGHSILWRSALKREKQNRPEENKTRIKPTRSAGELRADG